MKCVFVSQEWFFFAPGAMGLFTLSLLLHEITKTQPNKPATFVIDVSNNLRRGRPLCDIDANTVMQLANEHPWGARYRASGYHFDNRLGHCFRVAPLAEDAPMEQ